MCIFSFDIDCQPDAVREFASKEFSFSLLAASAEDCGRLTGLVSEYSLLQQLLTSFSESSAKFRAANDNELVVLSDDALIRMFEQCGASNSQLPMLQQVSQAATAAFYSQSADDSKPRLFESTVTTIASLLIVIEQATQHPSDYCFAVDHEQRRLHFWCMSPAPCFALLANEAR